MGSVSGIEVDVVVVGGGAIGVTAAIELAASGRSVRILEAADFTDGTSHGNAGLLCPSYATPIASPQALLAGLGWLVRGEGPFRLARPPWDPVMAGWLARFIAACRPDRLRRSTQILADLARRSITWHTAFARASPDYGLAQNGWLYVYSTARGYAEGLRHAQAVSRAGVAWRALSGSEAQAFEPFLREPAGAVYYPGDAQLDPHGYMLAASLRARAAGVDLRAGSRVISIAPDSEGVRLTTDRGEVAARYVVLAAGSWTQQLARSLGVRLPVLPARGYSASLQTESRPRVPLMLGEAHIVVTPMPSHVRMTTGLELGSFDPAPDPAKLREMAANASGYFASRNSSYADGWVGFRPLTPDGLPIVGPLSRYPRVIIATGHGTLGMTLAPATAQLVRGVIEGVPEPALVSPKRFAC